MVFEFNQGEQTFYDNLGDTWFGNFIPGFVEGKPILDLDDCFSEDFQNGEFGKTKNRINFVTEDVWGHMDIDYVVDPDNLSSDGVRYGCDSPLYDITSDDPSFSPEEKVFTCITSVNDRWSFAGDSHGGLWLQNQGNMTMTRQGALATTPNPIIRIFTSKSKTNSNVLYIIAFTTLRIVIELTFNFVTGVVLTTNTYDLNAAGDVDGCLIPYDIYDVCQDFTGNRFMVKGGETVYFLQGISGAQRFNSIDLVTGWVNTKNRPLTMIAMEFVTNQWVIILNDAPGEAMWYDTQNNTKVQITITNEEHHIWTHILIHDDGSKGILVGIYDESLTYFRGFEPDTEQIGQHRMCLYNVDLTPPTGDTATLTPTPIFSLDSFEHPVDSWDSYRMYRSPAIGIAFLSTYYKGEIFRGRRRYGTNQFWLVSSGRQDILSIGDRHSLQSFTATPKTSTSNLLQWEPPSDIELDSIAWQIVERAHCAEFNEEPMKYSCVWARDKVIGFVAEEDDDYFGWPCHYEDNQHPDVMPQEIDNTGFFTEVGLIAQNEIHDFDPTKDSWPDGRPFWYKYRVISYLNIESTSSVVKSITKQPIQPVHINDDVDMNLNFTNLPITSRDFTLEWDWLPDRTTDTSDFLMWQVCFFEDQNPTKYTGDWYQWFHYPQPHDISDGVYPWRFVLPWELYPPVVDVSTGHAIRCWVDGVNFDNSVKSKIVDRKYIRWTDDDVTSEDDKRYSPLMPDTVYPTTVIGWDKGGLWRASAKMTHVPPSVDTFNNEELIIDRQIVNIKTLSETSFSAICEFDANPNGDIFKRWDELDAPPTNDFMVVGGSLANPIMCAQEFIVNYEVEITEYQVYIEDIVNNPGILSFGVYTDGGLGFPTGGAIAPSYKTFSFEYGITAISPTFHTLVEGWNNLPLTPTVVLRPGRYFFLIEPAANYPVGSEYHIRTNQWLGDTNKNSIEYPVGGPWENNTDEDLVCRLLFDSGSISDGFVTESGNLLNFNFLRSTVSDGDQPIFEDNAYVDTGLWSTANGNDGDWSYANGSLNAPSPAIDLYLLANENDNYGIETRSVLIKTRARYNSSAPNDNWLGIAFHEQGQFDEFNILPKGYWLFYNLETGGIQFVQFMRYYGNFDWWDNASLDPFPFEFPLEDEWFNIWIKVVDDTVSVFVDKDGNTAEENYDIGNSIVHETIWREGDDPIYDFSHYGYFMLMFPDGSDMSIDSFRAYGKYTLNGITGGQGAFIDWGDDSDSGFVPSFDIEKIYSIEPDDDTEPFDAEIFGKGINDNDDLGFTPPWLDYPNLIAQENYERQIFEFNVDNATPTAVLNIPSNGFTGTSVSMDAIGSEDPENGDLVYTWDFGDGTPIVTTNSPFNTHTYNNTGIFSVSLFVTDDIGNSSLTVIDSIIIGDALSNFVELEFNHPINTEAFTRDTGTSSVNIPDKCGGEIQDSGPGNRVFTINGLHAPPKCCCDDVTDWVLALDLERVCSQIITSTEEYSNVNPFIPSTCDIEEYKSISLEYGACIVGDSDGQNSMFQQANACFLPTKITICAVSVFPLAFQLSGLPWSVRVSIQADAAGFPSGIPLLFTDVPVSAFVFGVWNKISFTGSITFAAATTFWVVMEPVPCPILSGQADFIEFSTSPLTFLQRYECAPTCIPACFWMNQADEISMILWGETPAIPETPPIYQCDIIDILNIGCCDIEQIAYTSGVAQSFDTTPLTQFTDVTTDIKIEIPMCRSEAFDGDIEVKLYTDILNEEQIPICGPVIILNEDIPVCDEPTGYISVTIDVCPWRVKDEKLYVSFTPLNATAGYFNIITTTPFSDIYRDGEKYRLINGDWEEQRYEDMCIKIYTMSDCEELGWCEHKYVDWLWCNRELVKIDLPGYCMVGGKIVDYNITKTTREPYAWIPFTLTFEEIDLEQVNC